MYRGLGFLRGRYIRTGQPKEEGGGTELEDRTELGRKEVTSGPDRARAEQETGRADRLRMKDRRAVNKEEENAKV